jgi:hypothetical protein
MQRNAVALIKNASCQSRKTAEQRSLGHESFSATKLTLYEKTDVMSTEDGRNKNSNQSFERVE